MNWVCAMVFDAKSVVSLEWSELSELDLMLANASSFVAVFSSPLPVL
jgi:hypothetical protein